MKDIVGHELVEGDEVAFNPPSYKGLTLGKITGFTPQKVRILFQRNDWDSKLTETLMFARDVAKVTR